MAWGNAVRLRWIALENVRCLASLRLDMSYLDGQALDQAVLFGDSGSGKTAVLDALAQICELGDESILSEAYGPRLIRLGQSSAHIAIELDHGVKPVGAALSLRPTDSPWLRPVTEVTQSTESPRLSWPPKGRIAYLRARSSYDLKTKLQQLTWRSLRLGKDGHRPPLHPALQRLRTLFARLDPQGRSLVFASDLDEPWLIPGPVPAQLETQESLRSLGSTRVLQPISLLSESERAVLDLAAQLTLREVVPDVAIVDEPLPSWSEPRRARLIPMLREQLPDTQLLVATSSQAILRSVQDYERLCVSPAAKSGETSPKT
jgi:energy-coupling factor transporter ATP-binding protein EcfA2